MKTIKSAALTITFGFLSITANAASLGAFNLSFDDFAVSGIEDWTGMFVTDANMNIASFNAQIGLCSSQIECSYENLTTMVFDGTSLSGFAITPQGAGESLEVAFDGSWSTSNFSDTVSTRDGTYSVTVNLDALFDIQFDDFGLPGTVDWTGMFVTANSISDIFLFTTLIGDCVNSVECTYDSISQGLNFNGTSLDGFVITALGGGESLRLNSDGSWSTTDNGSDSVSSREGS